MKFRKKPVVIEATPWFAMGDHPAVVPIPITGYNPATDHDKGWVPTLEGGHVVTPGDWIITGVKGEHYPCKPDIFAATYEPAESSPVATPAPTGEADDLLSDDDRMEAAIDAYNECDRPEADESARTFQRRRMRTAFRALLARATPPAAPAAVTDDDITRALEAWHESDASEDQDRAAMRLVLTRFAASLAAAASQPPQEH